MSDWTPADLLDRLGGNRQLALELIELFLIEYPRLWDALRTGVAQQDASAISRSAHALKGTLANFVDEGPTATAYAIERAAAESRLGEVPVLVEQLERELHDLTVAMRRAGGG